MPRASPARCHRADSLSNEHFIIYLAGKGVALSAMRLLLPQLDFGGALSTLVLRRFCDVGHVWVAAQVLA